MKKELSEDQLVELARKAPKVEVSDMAASPGKGRPKTEVSSVYNFIQELGIASGRNEVGMYQLYGAYESYTNNPVNERRFYKEIGKVLKKSESNTYKLNMKIITILEKVKELKNEQQEIKDKIPWTKQKS